MTQSKRGTFINSTIVEAGEKLCEKKKLYLIYTNVGIKLWDGKNKTFDNITTLFGISNIHLTAQTYNSRFSGWMNTSEKYNID